MKKYGLLFLTIVHFSLFSMKRSAESDVNLFQEMPLEIQKKILFHALHSVDDILSFAVTIQIVCHSWQNLLLSDKAKMFQLIKIKEANRDFFFFLRRIFKAGAI